ncbi:kinesin-related protein [Striga asiatica]|uniref:Kinesin-related protein n=1 Tax=Striga asiatica TaxID=4170 RepID=A0A5A7QNG0_STRAF|nr:kinesin-related protein [Striga asiatica]
MDRQSVSRESDVFESASINNAKQRTALVEWINCILPDINLPINASDEELRAFLIDGSILCRILNKLKPGSVAENGGSARPSQHHSENVQRFLSAMDEKGFPRFQVADLEKGSMKVVLDCLLTLKAHLDSSSKWRHSGERIGNGMLSSPPFGEDRDRRKLSLGSKSQHVISSPLRTDASGTLMNQVGQKFHEVFQLKQGSYTDIPAAKISEMMKSNSLDNAPTQSLLSVVNGILDESIELKNGEIPHRVACLLRKVVQEIERRICTQAEHLRTQNNLFKAREEKYQSRIKVLEALATGTSDETQIVMNQLQQIKSEKSKIEEKKKAEEHEISRLMKEKDNLNQEVSKLRQDLKTANNKSPCDEPMQEKIEEKDLLLLTESKNRVKELEERLKETLNSETLSRNRVKELEGRLNETYSSDKEVRSKMKELEDRLKETSRSENESRNRVKELEEKLNETLNSEKNLTSRVKELESSLNEALSSEKELRDRLKENEKLSDSKAENWQKKQHIYHIFTDFQLGALRELRFASQSIQQEIVKTRKSYSEEFGVLGSRMKTMDKAVKNYYSLLSENQKLHNELQELKGNIRVYCRIRPFLPGQKGKQSIIEYIGENGELIVVNPSKQGKEARRSFKFDKVYGPTSTQEEVFSDIEPLIQSVLDGYNVCIFAYGQTGSGKTYTMSGPDSASEKEWGVNYRALNKLFGISQSRESNFSYEVSVQMVEIYNEQVRDLLSNDASQKRYPFLFPDASIQSVKSTSEVLKLMSVGLKNRAKGSTAMNERSSRSHSVVSIHANGVDEKSGSSVKGSLHLVDLAGSERVDRSEVTGDRLKEAQHINKSLSALGDVIFALAQKSPHVPYRNSKLTQLLQASLGGQAKTLMFVQLNPDTTSYTESISTLKFAERVSGVELGAAKSSKDGRDVRELMEQVASLKDMIAKKDEEIETLQLLRDSKTEASGEKHVITSLRTAAAQGRGSRGPRVAVGSVTEELLRDASAVGSVGQEKTEGLGRLSLTGHLAGISEADNGVEMQGRLAHALVVSDKASATWHPVVGWQAIRHQIIYLWSQTRQGRSDASGPPTRMNIKSAPLDGISKEAGVRCDYKRVRRKMATSMVSTTAPTVGRRSASAQPAVLSPFLGFRSTGAFPGTPKTFDITSITSNGGRVKCMKHGFPYRENNRSPGYYDGRYWTMWKLPMFGCTDAIQVVNELNEAIKAHPDGFIRIIGFNNIRQVQVISFIAYKPPGY